jgi:hypothetical protein
MGGKGNIFVSRHAWVSATPRLLYACLIYSMGSIFFGEFLVYQHLYLIDINMVLQDSQFLRFLSTLRGNKY